MEMYEFKKGTVFTYQGKEYEIDKHVDMDYILAKDLVTHKNELLAISDITNNTPNKNLDRIDDIADEDWEVAKNRLEIIRPIIEQGLGKKELLAIAKQHNIHQATIYRWKEKYEATGLLQSLVPNIRNRGPKGHTRIEQAAELIMNKAIETLYLDKQKLPVRAVYREVQKRCRNADVTPPHENTFRRRVKKLSQEQIVAKRESRKIADRKYNNMDGMFPDGLFPLETVQIDNTPMDIILVDEVERKPIGRPYLTIAIDIYSRMIFGFYIALEAPSYYSVSQCLANGVLSKERYLQHIGVEGDWKIWGIPKNINLDNGPEFQNKELRRFCEQYGITVTYRLPGTPNLGGNIERAIGTYMREVHTLPGATFSNPTQRGQYNSDKEASLTLNELEKWITEFIVNVYHTRIHETLQTTPISKFEEGVFGDGKYPGTGIPAKIADENRFKIDLLPTFNRTIQQPGVKLDNITYYADVLRRWIKAKDEKTGKPRQFVFKRNPRDISTIYFYDPEIKEYFPLPYRNVSYPPMSMWELHEITRELKEKGRENYDEMEIFAAYERMDKIKEEAKKSTKTSRKIESSKKTHKKRNENQKIILSDDKKPINSEFDALFDNVQAFDDIEVFAKGDDE
ncbi:DDE-type integrase/transposase/recombinase [Sulfurimonas sp.]|uniref:DDE-type integrase/transposase/recombinase n=1 Tax=Sulfurimonas sp. TaxID=2022749 RepID=UPI0019DA72BA|nr:DDE-type integrase/transposase/recombinase [Sulfurimonas sp.]MBE0513912.1 DDE-type integrase/transposase/recombinase [Sulfurimonas sp.]